MPDMMDVIAKSDIVFTSTGATQPILDKAKLEEVLTPDNSLMLVDISVPLNSRIQLISKFSESFFHLFRPFLFPPTFG